MNETKKFEYDVSQACRSAVPFDLQRALDGYEWRSDFRWPLAHMDLRERQMATVSSILEVITAISDSHTRALALLVQAPLGNIIRTVGELTLLAEATGRERLVFSGATREFNYLSGKTSLTEIEATAHSRKKDDNRGFALGRRLARIGSWTRSPVRLVRAMIVPDHVAITHNPLMQDFAVRSSDAISFRHAEQILSEGTAIASEPEQATRIDETIERFAAVIGRCYPVAPAVVERMIALFRLNARSIVARGSYDLCGLSRVSKLPRSIWSGSAGPHAVRAIALEVRRRGGIVTGFDHGGSLAMVDDTHSIALRELAVNDRYVLPTAGCVDALGRTASLSASRPFGVTELVAGLGDPTFRVPLRGGQRGAGTKGQLYYIVTIFRGLRQLVPTLLPDPVYLDWQLRLVEALRQRGVDFVCKPHPEGILRGKRHPLEDVAKVENRPFEKIRDDAGGFLYDYSQSTTFWEAVCTDRPITLVDFGITRFNETVAPLIARRCHVIKARWDDRNLPSVDFDELAETVTRRQPADPSEFRKLLTGRD